jgi:hypothetical protein
MTPKRFWMFVTFAGFLLFLGGIAATIALGIETGERVPDSECSSTMQANVLTVCYVSDDPKVLIGVAPLLLGAGIAGIGIWRWIVAAGEERASGSDDGGGGLFGSIRALQQQAMESMTTSTPTMTAGNPPPEPPPSPPAPSD